MDHADQSARRDHELPILGAGGLRVSQEETVITLYLREARRIPQEDVVDHGR